VYLTVPTPLVNKFFDCNWRAHIALGCNIGKHQCKFEVGMVNDVPTGPSPSNSIPIVDECGGEDVSYGDTQSS
jgi:hypothetical protein